MTKVLSVVSGDNGTLIAQAAKLWIKPTDRVADVTYGKGNFWTEFRPRKLVTHDIAIDGVDFRNLPYRRNSFDVIVLDPPYVSKGGRDTATIDEMDAAYGMYEAPRTPEEVDSLMWAGLAEAKRVLRPGGRIFVKCMDYISSQKYHPMHFTVFGQARLTGFDLLDMFIFTRKKSGPQPKLNPDGTTRRQVHSHRAHSYLMIFGDQRAVSRG